jgi:hypothetical protein
VFSCWSCRPRGRPGNRQSCGPVSSPRVACPAPTSVRPALVVPGTCASWPAYRAWRVARWLSPRSRRAVVCAPCGAVLWMRGAHPVRAIPWVDCTSLLDGKASGRRDVEGRLSRAGEGRCSQPLQGRLSRGARQVVAERLFAKNNGVSLRTATPLACLQTACRRPAKRLVVSGERETGLEPATACLEGRNSTTELLPLMDNGDLRY